MTENTDKQSRLQKAQKKYAEKLKQEGIAKTTLVIEGDTLEKIRKLADAHGVTQNKLIGTMLAGQIEALMQVEEIIEVLPPEAAKLARHKARLLSSQGYGILPLVEQIGSQTVELMAESLPADEAEALRKKYDFKNLQSLRDAQEGAA